MVRGHLALIGLAARLACRGGEPPSGERTASAYSTGADSEARAQRIEGTNTGVEYQTSGRIPGVLTTLDQLKRAPEKKNFTALRGTWGTSKRPCQRPHPGRSGGYRGIPRAGGLAGARRGRR